MSRFILLRESCAGRREACGEALTAVRVGRAIEHRKPSSECRGFCVGRRLYGLSRYRPGAVRLRGVGEPKARTYDQCRDLGGLPVTVARGVAVAQVKAVAKRRKHGGEESDRLIVVRKPGEQSAGCRVADSVERRGRRNGSVWQTKHGPDTEPGDAPGAHGLPTDRPCHRRLRTTAGPEGCRYHRSEEPDALARKSGSVGGPSGNRRATPTGAEKSDSAIVAMKLANKAWAATWRSWRSEGPGATGDAKGGPCSEHRVGKPQDGLYAGRERSGTEGPQGLPSQPERGAGCASAHVRIRCARLTGRG